MCASSCSQNCIRANDNNTRTCDHRNGSCLHSCIEGFYGDQCFLAFTTSQDLPVAVIIGVTVPLVVIICVIVAIVVIYKRRRPAKLQQIESGNKTVQVETSKTRRLQINNTKDRKSDTEITTENATVTATHISTEINSENSLEEEEYIPETTYYNTSSELSVNMAIQVNDLNMYLETHDKEFFIEQFKKIPQAVDITTEAALSDENKIKNRYKNICPYDHSRVHLTINTEKKEGHYINASYIQDNRGKVKFIASQGPNKTMVNDFIRMLWEQKTEVVVMLTNLIEEGKVKCDQYWPESGEKHFGEIRVTLKRTQAFADYTIRRIELAKEKSNDEVCMITHYHFTSWPDQSVPSAPWALVDLAQRVFTTRTTSHIVVHCSAGVGRTGTFIALHNILQQAEETGQVDFYNTLVKLRKDRIFMIQTGNQYEFLHRATQAAWLCHETHMSFNDIADKIQNLKQKNILGVSKMEKEFQSVSKVINIIRNTHKDVIGKDKSVNDLVYQNSQPKKLDAINRFPATIPRDCDRPFLTCYYSDMSDYINAVFVQGFNKNSQHILTQLPLPATVTDLWRLVTQFKISLMVAFEVENMSTDETMAEYLPAKKGTTFSSGNFKVKCTALQEEELCDKYMLEVRCDKPKSDSHEVVHLTCKCTDLEANHLGRLMTKIKSYQPSSEATVLYMCRDGATYSGLCCVLSNLLDRLDSDSSLSVPLVVGAVKTVRPEVIPDMDEYSLVYDVMGRSCDLTAQYNNKANTINSHTLHTSSESGNIYSNL